MCCGPPDCRRLRKAGLGTATTGTADQSSDCIVICSVCCD